MVKATIEGEFCRQRHWLNSTDNLAEPLDTIVGDTEEETMTKDMLNTLVQFLT